MPSQSKADNGKHGEIPPMNHNAPERRSSLQHQTFRLSNEKVSSHRNRKAMKPGMAIEQNGPDQDTASAVPVMPLGNHPSRKVTEVDDVVKYMSSVPSYLQRLEKGDSVQEKALNFGVLDWGHLEKWMYLQKQVAHRRRGDSPPSSSSSVTASFSTFGSSSNNTRSTKSSSDQRKQSLAMNARRNSSVEDCPSESINEQKSVQVMNNRDSETSRDKPAEKGKGRHSHVKGISSDKPQPQDVGSSSSSSKVDDIPATAHNKGKSQIGRSVGEEKFHSSEQQSFPDNLQFAEDWLQDQCMVVEGMLDHLQESEHARRVSYDSAVVNNGRSVEVSRKSISGNFPPSDYRFANKPLLIPHSCPLPSISQSDEPSLSENDVLTANAQGEHMKPGQFSESSSEKFTAADKFGQDEVKGGAAPRRDLSPYRLFSAGLNRIRSSTLREGSSAQHIRQTTISDNSCEDNVTSHSSCRRSVTPHRLLSAGLNRIRNSSLRGSSGKEMKQTSCSDNLQDENAVSGSRNRRSPLMRRILDPLLKSRDQNQEFSTGGKMQIRVGLRSNEPCRSSDANIVIPEAGCSVQAERQVIPTRKALLKLVWKNELPFFVFSTNDDNILATTMRKGSISQKNNFNCIYTMFTANEVKKKGGVWKGQGNKGKKHDLACNVVGQMMVSSVKSTDIGSNDSFVLREFVLLGSELAPTAQGHVNPPFNSELAAIVIRVPYESSDNINELHSNNSIDSSQINSAENQSSMQNLRIEQKNENSGLATVAILPSGVHGISSTGEPSPLIERWKSGGSCDCGGWDEGCMLTILTDQNQVSRSLTSSQACSAAGTDQIELFPQGDNRESKHAFRMTFSKEGVYAVELGASIALVQAFAICISVLHSRQPHTLSMKAQSIQERTSTEHTSINCEKTQTEKTQTDVPARYVLNCPPLSPVRRA